MKKQEFQIELDRIFGAPEEIDGLAILLDRFEKSIPAGYLSHATIFPPPASINVAVGLLIAWGECKEPLPPLPQSILPMSGLQYNPDISFLQWVLQDKRVEILRLTYTVCDKDTCSFFSKLRLMAKHFELEVISLEQSVPTNQAHLIVLRLKQRVAEYARDLLPKALREPPAPVDFDEAIAKERRSILFRSEAFRYGLGSLASELAGKQFVVLGESIELDLDGLFNSIHSIRGFNSIEDAYKDIHESRELLRAKIISLYQTARESLPNPSSNQRDLHFDDTSNEVSCVEQITFRLDQLDHFFAHSIFWDLLRFDVSDKVVSCLNIAYGQPREIESYIERLGADVPVWDKA